MSFPLFALISGLGAWFSHLVLSFWWLLPARRLVLPFGVPVVVLVASLALDSPRWFSHLGSPSLVLVSSLALGSPI